jgi:hypothetical protein
MRKYCSFFSQKKNQADDLIFQFKKINKYSYKFVYQSILKRLQFMKTGKQKITLLPESTHGILNTNRQFFVF